MERFRQVVPGVLRGGAPSDDEVRVLKDIWGVKRIISLDLKAGEKINPICNKLDIEHIVIPIESDDDIDKIRTKKALRLLEKNIVSLLTSNPTTYIHCLHGRDRTGLAIVLFRIKANGWPAARAIKEAASMEFGEGLNPEDMKLFLSVIRHAGGVDTNDVSDVVTRARESIERGSITGPTNGSNYFSPITPVQDLVQDYPATGSTRDVAQADDKMRKRRKKLRRMYLQDINDAMAYVGMNEDINPMLRGLSPEGTGPLGILPFGNYYL
ncbi:MAG TPA: hypothetical protein VI423_00640 [Paenisporosarcina sp.]|nr:hypothetical protein [Paenisporosarcina sp.]